MKDKIKMNIILLETSVEELTSLPDINPGLKLPINEWVWIRGYAGSIQTHPGHLQGDQWF